MTMPQQPPRRHTNERPRHVVIVGGGRVGRAVAARLPANWTVMVVDHQPPVEALLAQVAPKARFLCGDGSSRLVLAACGLDAYSVLIAATSSDAVNREAADLARRSFEVQERVVLTSLPTENNDGIRLAEQLAPADAIAGHIVNRISLESSRAVDVGLGIGEILQVTVLEGSPVIGRALADYGARHWLLAAVYRDGRLLVPHGNTQVEAGDRVLLVGDPVELQDVAAFFRGGAPVFPSQYGARVAWMGGPAQAAQATDLAARVGMEAPIPCPISPNEGPRLLAWCAEQSVGCLTLPSLDLPWHHRFGLRPSPLAASLAAIRRPFLVVPEARLPVQRLLVCLSDVRRQREVALAAIDLARLLDLPLHALSVADGEAVDRPDLDRLARLYGVSLQHRTVAGNPVREIRAAATEHDLVVLGIRAPHNGLFSPDVSVHLLHGLPAPALFVPWSASG